MELDAETVFNYLGKRYEDAFADSPNLHDFIKIAAGRLPDHSKVLDIGCGTGKPVAATLASAGHDVHGIDVSEEMVKIASSQVRGTFEKADMRAFKPDTLFDGIFAILSLFQITPGETNSMCYKFAEWLQPGGYLVLGVTPSTTLPPNSFTYDNIWHCARQIGKLWMDKYMNETFFSEEGWKRLLQRAGFAIEAEVCYTFTPNDPAHNCPETHHLLLAKKVEKQPLFGPYPTPSTESPSLSTPIRNLFRDRLVSSDLESALGGFQTQTVLSLGAVPKFGLCAEQKIEVFDGCVEAIPFQSGTFDVVLALWKLDLIVDMKLALREMLRVMNRRPHSRLVIVQGAPDNELTQIIDATASTAKVKHQGRIMRLAMGHLADMGFRNITVRRIHGQYSFPEPAVAERCKAVVDLLSAGSDSTESTEDMHSGLRLHFLGSQHTIGNEMVMLEAKWEDS